MQAGQPVGLLFGHVGCNAYFFRACPGCCVIPLREHHLGSQVVIPQFEQNGSGLDLVTFAYVETFDLTTDGRRQSRAAAWPT